MGAKWVIACSATFLATAAMAGLKEKPPKGVALSGLWQLDPYRSDDATAVLQQARSQMKESGGGRSGGRGRGGSGGFPGGGGGGWHGGHHRGGDSSSHSEDESGAGTSERGQLLTELAKDGKTLTYTTTASGAHLPKVKITRTYVAAF